MSVLAPRGLDGINCEESRELLSKAKAAMIREIKLENFRSIQKAHTRFSNTRLNVLIGANGSGKSNLVKALEFIGRMHEDGLLAAIIHAGGVGSVLPKSVPESQFSATPTMIAYNLDLGSPGHYPAAAPMPQGIHELEIAWKRNQSFRIRRERLTLTEPLTIERAFQRRGSSEEGLDIPYEPSTFSVARSTRNNLRVETTPPLTQSNLAEFAEWIGFGAPMVQRGLSVKDFRNIVLGKSSPNEQVSLAEIGEVRGLSFASQFGRFRHLAQGIKRYDLQLLELRKEQPITTDVPLSPQGTNMASVLRQVHRSEMAAAERIRATLEALAPHVVGAKWNTLRSAKEFVEFLEVDTARPVESWDASDGTLRALAILLAVESHVPGGTLLIEEPEVGLHPWAIQSLMTHIRQAVEEREVQVLITTHSEQVLSEVAPDEVIVASRTPDSGTVFAALPDMLEPGHQVEIGDVGRMWVKGLLGAVPHA
jgi:predicted ATPase